MRTATMPRWSRVLLLCLLSLAVAWRVWVVFWESPAALHADLAANWAAVDTATSAPAYAWALTTLWMHKVYLFAAGALAWQLEAVGIGAACACQLATQQPGQPDPLATFSTGINDTLHAWGVRPVIPAWRDAINAELIDSGGLAHIFTYLLTVTLYYLLTVLIVNWVFTRYFQYTQ